MQLYEKRAANCRRTPQRSRKLHAFGLGAARHFAQHFAFTMSRQIDTISSETMNALVAYLSENCCGGMPELCAPEPCRPAAAARRKKELAS